MTTCNLFLNVNVLLEIPSVGQLCVQIGPLVKSYGSARIHIVTHRSRPYGEAYGRAETGADPSEVEAIALPPPMDRLP